MESYYDDESAPSQAGENTSVAREKPAEDHVPEDKLALVQTSFFKDPPKPGDREMVEVVHVYENEVSIKCVYGDNEEEEAEPEMGLNDASAPSEAEDEMMY